MSNEPITSEPMLRDEVRRSMPDAGRSADAELVLAAVGRMEAALSGERSVNDRLRAGLAAMADTIAAAKRAMQAAGIKPDAPADGKAIDLATILDELEHRVDALRELANGAAPPAAGVQLHAPEPAAVAAEPNLEPNLVPSPELSRVPTVSDVVSRLGRGEAIMPATDAVEAAPAAVAVEGVPTVTMLEAMVEALTASASQAAPVSDLATREPEPVIEPPTPEPEPELASAPLAHEPAMVAEPTPPAPEPEPTLAVPEAAPPAEPVVPEPEPALPVEEAATADQPPAVPPTPPQPRQPIMPELELLTSFARLESYPILPPEIGTAVIFARREESASRPALEPQSPAPEPLAAAPEPVALEPPSPAAPEPPATVAEPPADASQSPPSTAEADDDPAAFLLGPAPAPERALPAAAMAGLSEPDPAAFLLEEPSPAKPARPAAASPTAAPVHPAKPRPPAAAPPDPLAPLKAMTAEEKIALFS